MTMEEKNQIITQYIYNSFLELKQLCPKDKGFFGLSDREGRHGGGDESV